MTHCLVLSFSTSSSLSALFFSGGPQRSPTRSRVSAPRRCRRMATCSLKSASSRGRPCWRITRAKCCFQSKLAREMSALMSMAPGLEVHEQGKHVDPHRGELGEPVPEAVVAAVGVEVVEHAHL